MAKRLILNALKSVLSDYLEIDDNNFDLNLAVWSGSIVLHDVKLKTDKLFRHYNLSFVHGIVQTLEVQIPWTALMNSPVKVKIDGAYLQVCPLDVSALDKEETRRRVLAVKKDKIAFADKFISFPSDLDGDENDGDDDSSASKAGNKDKTWVQIWTAKIVDNLEISLNNIHLRYEDSERLYGSNSTYSAGLTLSSFVLTTCDLNWNSKFVARDVNDLKEAIRKMCKIENFGVYWNMKSMALANLPLDEWRRCMHDIIYRSDDSVPIDMVRELFADSQLKADGQKCHPLAMKYIVSPTNKLVIKVIHNDLDNIALDTPKYDVSIVNERLDCALDGLQYKQLQQTMELIGSTERGRQPYMYKPAVRPSGRASVKAWWKYACKLVLKRPRYIHLVKMSKTAAVDNEFADSLSKKEREEMEALEERLSLHTIIIFRHQAAEEMIAEKKSTAIIRKKENKKKKGSSLSLLSLHSFEYHCCCHSDRICMTPLLNRKTHSTIYSIQLHTTHIADIYSLFVSTIFTPTISYDFIYRQQEGCEGANLVWILQW
jgi:vacuolar protein sorting-associated protein 13A/C